MNPVELPKLTKHVTDFSGVLTSEQIESLSQLLADHESKTTEQVTVVLFPHREGNELLDIGLKIFNDNGIGQKNLNNGLLLIIATDEKKIRIITGKGMEIQYSEMRCRDIIENHLRPLLNQGKYEELIKLWRGIVRGSIDTQVINKQSTNSSKQAKLELYQGILLIWIFFSFLTGGILLIFPIFILTILIGGALIRRFQWSYNKSVIIGFIVSLLITHGGISTYCSYKASTCIQISSTIEKASKSGHSSSSSSSSSSSFGGGGGSSNGGGYGD